MKTILTILLSVIPIFTYSQIDTTQQKIGQFKLDSVLNADPYFLANYIQAKQNKNEAIKLIALSIISTTFNAIGEANNHNGHPIPGHLYNAASIATLIGFMPFMHPQRGKWWVYPVTLLCIRVGEFDYVYNVTRGKPLNYLNPSSSVTDKTWRYFGGNTFFPRATVFTIGIFLPLNELK
jgi:hypothetical protein